LAGFFGLKAVKFTVQCTGTIEFVPVLGLPSKRSVKLTFHLKGTRMYGKATIDFPLSPADKVSSSVLTLTVAGVETEFDALTETSFNIPCNEGDECIAELVDTNEIGSTTSDIVTATAHVVVPPLGLPTKRSVSWSFHADEPPLVNPLAAKRR
jgi:hypothetical protein